MCRGPEILQETFHAVQTPSYKRTEMFSSNSDGIVKKHLKEKAVHVYALCVNNPQQGLSPGIPADLRAELMPESNPNSTRDQAVNPSRSVSFQT